MIFLLKKWLPYSLGLYAGVLLSYLVFRGGGGGVLTEKENFQIVLMVPLLPRSAIFPLNLNSIALKGGKIRLKMEFQESVFFIGAY